MGKQEHIPLDRPKQDVLRDIRLFMYNPQTKKIMGRTPIGWAKLLIWYILSYIFLCGLSAGMFSVFYFNLVPKDIPRLTGKHSVLDGVPGISRQPSIIGPIYSSTNKSLLEFVKPFSNNLHDYLSAHYKTNGGENAIECTNKTVLEKNQTCKLNMKELFPANSICTGSQSYGYLMGKPCVLVKVNKMFDWTPELYEKDELPSDFPTNRYYKNKLAMTCVGATDTDRANIGYIKYIPEEGIDIKYYPYNGQENYLSPFIWAQFMNMTHNMVVKVRCKFFAKNIRIHRRVDIRFSEFEIVID